MKKTPIVPIRWIHEGHDTDLDKVPNYIDCNPWNPHQHGIKPSITMQKRLEKLPIMVTDEPHRIYTAKRFEMPSPKWKGIYHIASKKAKKLAPEARRQLLGAIKKYPSIVGEIERAKPKIILYSSRTFPEEEEEEPSGIELEERVFVRPGQPIYRAKKTIMREIEKQLPKRERRAARLAYIEETPYPMEETIGEIGRKQRRRVAGTLFHELTHVRQEKELGRKEMQRQQREYGYLKQPMEIEAEKYARKKIKERGM